MGIEFAVEVQVTSSVELVGVLLRSFRRCIRTLEF